MAAEYKSVGRDLLVYWSDTYTGNTEDDIPSDYELIGSIRGKEFGPEWETVDSTADTSDGNVRTSIATYISEDGTYDGVVDTGDDSTQLELEQYVRDPTSGQPRGWIRIIRPISDTQNYIYDQAVLFTSYRLTAPYDDVNTFAMETKSLGSVFTQTVSS